MTSGMRPEPRSDLSIHYCSRVIISVAGALVGRVATVDVHPNGDLIWLAFVDINDGNPPTQVIYGGDQKLAVGDRVPVVLPGARLTVVDDRNPAPRTKRLRARNYRGQRSNGMLCSLDELGWLSGGPNEVAILCGLDLGFRLDDFPEERRPEVVVDWERAALMAKTATDTVATTAGG
jgi:tRNA-binding EMAP/Myf-like protein